MNPEPSTNGGNGEGDSGRDGSGRFTKGNAGGPGNPFARRAAEIRSALYDAVTVEDVAAVVRALVEAAKGGQGWAVRELLDRLLGRPVELDILARLEALEDAAEDAT